MDLQVFPIPIPLMVILKFYLVLAELGLRRGEPGLLFTCGGWAFSSGGLSCCGLRALEHRPSSCAWVQLP